MRRNKAIVDERKSFGVTPQVTARHPYINIWTRAGRNGKDLRPTRLLILRGSKRNALA